MSSIVTAILSSTVGFLCGKARDSAAEKLKDGGLADEKIRKIIVQDLTDIKSKLDCLSLKDLDSSYSFLKEGVALLNLALDMSNKDQKTSEAPVDETTRVVDDTSGILNAALSLPEAIQKLKISSKEPFASAKDRFKASRERATDAFNNKSLTIKDRIMACKLRVAAGILEIGLEDPMAATTSCLLSLEELHDLPAVQEMFSVFLKRGWKSKFNKAERSDNVMSVLFINHALFDFAAKHSCKYPNVLIWPGIEVAGRKLNPILNAIETLRSRNKKSALQLNRIAEVGLWFDFAVNSRCEIIELDDDKFMVNSSAGESKVVTFADTESLSAKLLNGIAVAADSDNNVYILRSISKSNNVAARGVVYSHVLYVFDRNHDMKHKFVLDIFDENETIRASLAVDRNKNIVMIKYGDSNVYVLDVTGQLKYKFKRDGDELRSLSISNTNDVMIPSCDSKYIHIFTTEGRLKSTIEVCKDYEVMQVAFHHGISKIMVLANHVNRKNTALLCYSEAGELEHTQHFEAKWFSMSIISHFSGPFAVKRSKKVIFI
ncbi:uncharacterized protein LOC114534575 [Dendronephthya gigantea]|uniref:uncharacterized protein LOC114534575 n=1 Tax=Dendronephthya gigantea TaxID=151771 RepID=UPI00106AA33C|nr:uncharacterized protein LOC114534575 [Dendronephthya gigantea]